MPTSNSAIQGAWIVVVESILSTDVGPACLNNAWTEAGFRVLSVYKAIDGGSWRSIDKIPMCISSLPAPHGLGHKDAVKPSEENVFVVLHPNSIPPIAPLLGAAWWRPCYKSRSIPKPNAIHGTPQSVTMPIWRDSGNRIEFEVILEGVQTPRQWQHFPRSHHDNSKPYIDSYFLCHRYCIGGLLPLMFISVGGAQQRRYLSDHPSALNSQPFFWNSTSVGTSIYTGSMYLSLTFQMLEFGIS